MIQPKTSEEIGGTLHYFKSYYEEHQTIDNAPLKQFQTLKWILVDEVKRVLNDRDNMMDSDIGYIPNIAKMEKELGLE